MNKYFKLLLLILWMSLIFFLSNQTGSESCKTSNRILILLNNLGIDINNIFGIIAHFLIRKSAHLFVYFVLSILLYNFLKEYSLNAIFVAFLCSLLYACLDELHQTFIPFRYGNIIDVFIDLLGALIGLLLILIIKLINKSKMNFRLKS